MSYSIRNKRIGWGGNGGSVVPPAPIPFVDIVYNELYALITSEGLIKGTIYRLLDYKSVNFINGSYVANSSIPAQPNFDAQQIYTGPNEVLILKAMSTYELEPQCFSETYQGDIIQYRAYTNKIGLPFYIKNGNTLPDSSIVSGFDLQWDGVNVYFNMPTGYPALFGQIFSIENCIFNSGETVYNQIGYFSPLTPVISIPQGDISNPNIPMSRISVRDSGTKIVLLDLTFSDYTNYVIGSLNLYTIYEVGNAYGLITQRNDTFNSIITPFDFRNIKYRRFQVDLTTINSSLGLGYWGTPNYLRAPYQQEGNPYQDFYVFGNNGSEANNISWTIESNQYYWNGNVDNNVFLGSCSEVTLSNYTYDNTFDSAISSVFEFSCINNITFDIQQCRLGMDFSNNLIGSKFSDNQIGNSFNGNNILLGFAGNNIGYDFYYNDIANEFVHNIIGNSFASNSTLGSFQQNKIGDSFQNNYNIGTKFVNNQIGDLFQNNDIAENFTDNYIGKMFNYNSSIGAHFQNNQILDNFTNNSSIGDNFQYNQILDSFTNNQVGSDFQQNNIGFNCHDNAFGNSCIYNILGNGFANNVLSDDFSVNRVGVNFEGNTTFGSFTDNNIGNYFQANICDDGFEGNSILENFSSNTISVSFMTNKIGDAFYGNGIADSFTDNEIGNYFQYNPIIGTGFSLNKIESNFMNNISIGNNFVANSIGNYFNHNTISDGFEGNSIVGGFTGNTTSGYVENNVIGLNFGGNIIANGFIFNSINSNFENNTIDVNCVNNTILDWAQNNTISGGFNGNRIGYYFGINIDYAVYGNQILSNFQNNQIGNYFNNNTFAYEDTGTNNCMFNVFQDLCYNNYIGGTFQYNNCGILFQNNTIGSNFFGNNTEAYFSDNIIGDYTINNTVSTSFNGNTIFGEFGNNVITQNFSNCNIQYNFQNNVFHSQVTGIITSATLLFSNNFVNTSLSYIDFSASTLVYEGYTKTVIIGSDNNLYINYFDGIINQFITPITT